MSGTSQADSQCMTSWPALGALEAAGEDQHGQVAGGCRPDGLRCDRYVPDGAILQRREELRHSAMYVAGTSLEAPVFRIDGRQAPVSAQVEVDQLRVLGQPTETRLEVGVVVGEGPTVPQHHRRAPRISERSGTRSDPSVEAEQDSVQLDQQLPHDDRQSS
jgi:hypothetical protein